MQTIPDAMLWRALWIAVLAVAILVLVAWVNNVRFGRRVAREVGRMWADSVEPLRIDRHRLEALPEPVRRYLAMAVGGQAQAVRTVMLRHGGTFRAKLDGAWMPIRGEQYFTAAPPAFVWRGRVHLLPGLWIDARDRSVHGAGNMHVWLESSFTLADSSGPEVDQGALLRLLGEMVWFPTAFLDDRYLSWSTLDARRARATLSVNGRQVMGVFEFGPDGLPVSIIAERYRDLGGGKAALTPWSGEMGGYREVEGLLVPHQMTAAWHVDGQRIPYARFLVERLEYDVVTPF